MSGEISIEKLRALLHYDPETGVLIWKARGSKWWDGRYAGRPALQSVNAYGYHCGRIFNRHCFAHRAAWAIETGAWPEGDIDHIDGNKTNNAFTNLRDVTKSENQRNTRRPKNNTSGVIGVTWDRQAGKWKAQLGIKGGKSIGVYARFEDAVAARKAAELAHGYHPNTGRV
jgi:hypothetical protein